MHPVSVKIAIRDLSDIDLARQIVAGNRDAMTLLMRRNNQSLYRTARSILKDDAEAEDAVQEAYLHAYQSMDKFRDDAKLSTWLVRIVVNEALGRLRKRERRAEVIQLDDSVSQNVRAGEPNMSESPPEQPERSALRAETRRLIEAKIDQLPDAFRTVFVLRALQEMTVDEASTCLGIPAATVRTRYFRARGLLREALAREIDFSLEEAFSFAGARCDRIVVGVLSRLQDLQVRDA